MGLKVTRTNLPEVMIVEPSVYEDGRGFFFESFNAGDFCEATGVSCNFVQDNHSRSVKDVLRGLHYQIANAQGKLVRVLEGVIFDVAVDIRRESPTFGHYVAVELSAENKKQLWVPANFAHGFLVVSDVAQVLYKTTDYYSPEHERSIAWDDPSIGIVWPLNGRTPRLSSKDETASSLATAELPM